MDLENNAQPTPSFFAANRRSLLSVLAALLVVVVVAVAVTQSGESSGSSSGVGVNTGEQQSAPSDETSTGSGSTAGDGSAAGDGSTGAGDGTSGGDVTDEDSVEYQGDAGSAVVGQCTEVDGFAVVSGLEADVNCVLTPTFERALVADGTATFSVPLTFTEVDLYRAAEGSSDCTDFVGVLTCAA